MEVKQNFAAKPGQGLGGGDKAMTSADVSAAVTGTDRPSATTKQQEK